ncbi:type IV conjugative transfer system pilin TraA [Vibrio coralliilyticus]|nr:hypothetical protein N779_25635 [Vibrio coralliilyticus OCN008]NRF16346.1 type IV conjugative transfer system pilin TraA [Vibrio coralliilyticus]QXL80304.1 type IV conjugative transfer system pilin TraA [Vibrio sp.]NRF32004.1 type IV conjugative transfer system pilin TraA [Vibrio coralliilyticus]NRF55140.1 type IV conjugative transfer system pilin TraA [Vibrio coralliilyticus]
MSNEQRNRTVKREPEKSHSSSLRTRQPFLLMAAGVVLVLLAIHSALGADLFSAGKQTIKDTAGSGSAVENALLASGAIGAVSAGFMTRNWMGAVGGFIGGMIFWEVVKPLVGLS